ncbi:hypothetical protein K9L67_01735 [Candidatus Woesearchaeota archaeon]|nr:hypothetical protein [Candidatus Woesearchaeota archaeon]MCF7900925.1 hypothetical protein [Candidatus Woesearchaeota archaeon]MCF8012877.1 hypothetical protein [Candidatus Woesearchaeota archaeon]
MNKLAGLIKQMNKDELQLLNRDLIAGNIDKILRKRLNELNNENFDEKQCPVCGGNVNEESFKIEFGKLYLRRKAYFDAVDCMQYFIETKIKKQHIDIGY